MYLLSASKCHSKPCNDAVAKDFPPKAVSKGSGTKMSCIASSHKVMTLQKILDTNFGLFEHREYSTTVPKICYLKEKIMINHWILASKF